MVWDDINHLADCVKYTRKDKIIVATSGGFDCLHVGHIRCILSSAQLGHELIVIVNGDDFLLRKKGYVFMPAKERIEIIASLQGVDHVILWDDGTQFVANALAILKPDLFTKGGDRSTPESIAECEREVCKSIDCRIVLGVGGSNKAQSSSNLTKGCICQSSIKELL